MIAFYQEPKWLLFSLEGSRLNIDSGTRHTPLTSWKTTVLLGTRDPLTPPAILASQKSTLGLNACILGPRPVSCWLVVISEGTKPQSLSFKQLGEDSRFHKRTNTNYKQMISFCFDIDFGMWPKKSTVKQLQPPCQTWCLRFDGLSYQSFKAQNSKRLNARD